MIDVFKGLNEQQKEAVAAIDGIYNVESSGLQIKLLNLHRHPMFPGLSQLCSDTLDETLQIWIELCLLKI